MAKYGLRLFGAKPTKEQNRINSCLLDVSPFYTLKRALSTQKTKKMVPEWTKVRGYPRFFHFEEG